MTTRICETRRRPAKHAGPHSAALRKLLSAEALRNRYRRSRWNERDRRVQRLRGWLSDATG